MEKRKIFLNADFVSGVLSAAFGIGMALANGMQYGVYPLAVYLLLAAIGVLLILSGVRRQANSVKKITLKEIGVIALLFVNPLLGEWLGFYLSGFLSVVAVSFLFQPVHSAKEALKTILYCFGAAVVVFLVFTELLRISTPFGFLF